MASIIKVDQIQTASGGTPSLSDLGVSTAGLGKVLQVKTFKTTSHNENSSTTFADSLLTLNITPSSTTSKVMVLSHAGWMVFRSSGNETGGVSRLVRDDGSVTQLASHYFYSFAQNLSSSYAYHYHGMDTYTVLDSPSTTSEITYKIQIRQTYANAIRYTYHNDGSSNNAGEIVLIELAGD